MAQGQNSVFVCYDGTSYLRIEMGCAFLSTVGVKTQVPSNVVPLASGQLIPDWKQCVEYTPPFSGGVVIRVYDGDSITVASQLPAPLCNTDPTMYRIPVRLAGIDAPEMHSNNLAERDAARHARAGLERFVLHRRVRLERVGKDKYGRFLARVWLPATALGSNDDVTKAEVCVNDWIVLQKFAVPYDGGTKAPFQK